MLPRKSCITATVVLVFLVAQVVLVAINYTDAGRGLIVVDILGRQQDKTRTTNSASESPSSCRIVYSWMGENPTTTNRGDFTYYHDFAKALQTDAGTQQCEGSLSDCIHKTQAEPDCAIYAPLIPHGISSENPKLLSRISKGIASDLKKSAMMMEQEGSHDPASAINVPCVSIVLFLNKAYKQLQEKVEAFKMPFEEHNLLSRVNLISVTWSPHAAEWGRQFGLPFLFVPFATDTERFNLTAYSTPWENRFCDLLIRWDPNPDKYELRREIDDLLVRNQETGKNSSTVDIQVSAPTRFLVESEYKEEIRRCKMSVTTIGMPGTLDLLGTRYYEIMASGSTLLLAQYPKSTKAKQNYLGSGLIDGVTYAGFSDLTDLVEKVRYYKTNGAKATAIIAAAHEIARNQSWQQRAEQAVKGILRESKCTDRQNIYGSRWGEESD